MSYTWGVGGGGVIGGIVRWFLAQQGIIISTREMDEESRSKPISRIFHYKPSREGIRRDQKCNLLVSKNVHSGYLQVFKHKKK